LENSQDVLQADGRLTCFQINNEPHTHACCERQLGLGQAQCFAGVSHSVGQVLWRFDRCRHLNFLFGKLCGLMEQLSRKLTDREIMPTPLVLH